MKIDTALILCAGYGKRLNPLTLHTPKPLLKISNLTLLENTINLIKNLDIKKIKLNTFYLKDKIKLFLKKKNFDIDIEIIDDGDQILDTGGGIKNMMKKSLPKSKPHFLVFNPDTIWDEGYVKTIKEMIKFYFLNQNHNTLLVVNKNLSFDKSLKGDFSFYNDVFKGDIYHSNKLIKHLENNFIFTGCQIINSNLVIEEPWKKISNFSILKIWNAKIDEGNLLGFESKKKFYHVTNIDIYKQLLKNY